MLTEYSVSGCSVESDSEAKLKLIHEMKLDYNIN
jgi:hypothetical protein